MVAIDGDEGGLTSDCGEVDKSPIVVHRLLEFLESIGEHPIEFPWKNRRVPRDNALALRKGIGLETLREHGASKFLTLCSETWKSISRAL